MAKFLNLYRRLARYPLGKWVFTKGITFTAPYFKTISPRLVAYDEGYAEFVIPDKRSMHNHLGTVHAIALCNLAELCGALALDAALPAGLRWIPQGMTVRYLKKASGPITGKCRIKPEQIQEGSVLGRIDLYNTANEAVFTATIDFHVSKLKS